LKACSDSSTAADIYLFVFIFDEDAITADVDLFAIFAFDVNAIRADVDAIFFNFFGFGFFLDLLFDDVFDAIGCI